jgi:hypothetical protein
MFWCFSGTQRPVELEQAYEAAARVFGIRVMDDYLWLDVSALETSRMVLGAVFRVLEKWSFSQTLYQLDLARKVDVLCHFSEQSRGRCKTPWCQTVFVACGLQVALSPKECPPYLL